jgi:hypothetical protein
LQNCGLEDIYLNIYIDRDDFRAWLKKRKKWPLAEGCLLGMWLGSEHPGTEAKAKAVGSDGGLIQAQDKRQSQLYIFIWHVYQVLKKKNPKPTSQQVWWEMKHNYANYDTDKIIQEIDGEQISWCSGYGNEQTLKRSSFDKTLSNIKKHPPF